MRPLTFLDGGEIFVKINGFHFASNAPNFTKCGLNLNLVEIFEVIRFPKPHDTLGNVSDGKKTLICTWIAMKICKDLVHFMFHIYLWDWWLDFIKLFKNYYVKSDVKWSPIHHKGSQKFTFGASISTLKGSQFRWKSCAKSFIPIGSHIIHLMISVRLKFVFNHLPRPLYFCLCTSLSVKLPRGWWILLDAHKHEHIES